MKILELRFKNLNSLYGEWLIDFSTADYVADGIFALTGPTGAGKSTILDAICLALYGATPRLGKITKSGNEIMSRQTGECYAEVLFEAQAGRFRCHWEQRRARKSADGKLQDQEHQIIDADSGKPIETKKSLVAGVIEEKTGMDFERFTRSILLAQGGFDTFLKADAEQKSKILEQITGTGIYSEISRRVHERQREERERLNLLTAEISGIQLLDTEQEEELQQQRIAKQEEEKTLATAFERSKAAIDWLQRLTDLRQECDSLLREQTDVQQQVEAFQPDAERLVRALAAASLDGRHTALSLKRTQLSESQDKLARAEKGLAELERIGKEQAQQHQQAQQHSAAARQALFDAAPLIQQVRSLDQSLLEQRRQMDELEQQQRQSRALIAADQQRQQQLATERSAIVHSLAEVEDFLEQQAADRWLVEGLAGVEEQLKTLLWRKNDIQQKKVEQGRAAEKSAEGRKELVETERQLTAAQEVLAQSLTTLDNSRNKLDRLLNGRLLREYQADKEALLREMALLAKIAELEEQRNRLEDGKPCPLCGACEHPYAQGNVPPVDETEQKIEALTQLIEQIEQQNLAVTEAEKNATQAQQSQLMVENRLATAVAAAKTAEQVVAEKAQGLAESERDFAVQSDSLASRLLPLGISDLAREDLAGLCDRLRSRQQAWLKQVERKSGIEKRLQSCDSDDKSLTAVIASHSRSLTELQQQIEKLAAATSERQQQRQALYADKDPAAEELRLNNAFSAAEQQREKVAEIHHQLQKNWHSSKQQIADLQHSIAQQRPDLLQLEALFKEALLPLNFATEQQFVTALLPASQRNELASREKRLTERQAELNSRQQDRQARLAAEQARQLTDQPLEQLMTQLQQEQQSLTALRESLAAIDHSLKANRQAQERMREKKALIDAQKKECLRWERLHSLIGSADGKKYRNFAQGLTFEMMVAHANRQLQKMSDRYLLLRDKEAPLELNVMDNYQAGEVRSTKNLSGGESFIVSLALALGLSQMASRKVRVDSLFLDEGFGSLDEEALDTALETLSGLQQDGKLIGVISHVLSLKERIATQIQVVPQTGGKSVVRGPGCGKVEPV